ncbi:MAG: AI-2E family transporter, partial [Candidatus Nanoarchaeia archaeon]
MARIMDETYFRKISTTILLALLIVLSFLLLKPILLSVIIAFILAFVFNPVYCWLTKIVKNRNISAAIMVILLGIIIVLPFWFLTPIFIDQSFRIYQSAQQMDFVGALKSIFPSLFASDQFSQEVGTILGSFVTRTANSMVNALSKLILDFPKISLQFLVVFFTFFFVLRDKEELIEYIKGLLPFSKDIENKLFAYSKAITMSVIYGQVVIGIVQGLVVG